MQKCEQVRKSQLPDNALAHARASALDSLRSGYEFLTALDHSLRLTVGRTTRLPAANPKALSIIATRMQLASRDEILELLTIHRLAIRDGFENIVAKVYG